MHLIVSMRCFFYANKTYATFKCSKHIFDRKKTVDLISFEGKVL